MGSRKPAYELPMDDLTTAYEQPLGHLPMGCPSMGCPPLGSSNILASVIIVLLV